MTKRTGWLFATVALTAVATCGWLAGADDAAAKVDNDVRAFMRVKLEASTRILEGLTTENFQLIRDGAKTLRTMSTAEKWRVTNDPLYRQYSLEFGQFAERLDEKGKVRNLDGATLAWVECTMACIRCHNHARAIKIARN